VDGRPNRRNKAAFSNFSGVGWTGRNWEAGISVIKLSDHVLSQLSLHCASSDLSYHCKISSIKKVK